MTNNSTLFLSQSYRDTWDDYKRSISLSNFPTWDYIILTASNENQAKNYLSQLQERYDAGFLPKKTKFKVIPDLNGQRIGSGGATLSVIKYLFEEFNVNQFNGKKVLVIHSGGDSKRIPQYSALGKLFSPVPHQFENGRNSTLFDELMMVTSSIAPRIREGMLSLSGDVLPLFNPLQIDYNGKDAAAISFKEDVSTGKNHGVFLVGENNEVKKFLHKHTEESLRAQGAVSKRGTVDIDTGAIIFSPDVIKALYSLISTNDKYDESKYLSLVNSNVRLSLYGDFLYPLASDSTLEDFYKEKAETCINEELITARERVWKALNKFNLKIIRLAPAKFIHFGTTNEILKLMNCGVNEYSELGWSNKVGSSIGFNIACYNSVISEKATVGKNCYLENSYIHGDVKIGDNVLLSFIEIENANIPSNVVVHGLKQKDGKYVVRIFGVDDNPKSDKVFGRSIMDFLKEINLSKSAVCDSDEMTLWNCNFYPVCDSMSQALNASLNFYDVLHGKGNLIEWKNSVKKSLASGFNDAEGSAIISHVNKIKELVCLDLLDKHIDNKTPTEQLSSKFNFDNFSPACEKWLEKRLSSADTFRKIRLYYYLHCCCTGENRERFANDCFTTIRQSILDCYQNEIFYNDAYSIKYDKHVVKLPLRVNWGGGWTDTPPYCMENGGCVLNCAILLNGEKPSSVTLEKIKERKIVFESRDMGTYGEFTDIKTLQATGDPYDPFALQKACLIACGVIPQVGGDLDEILSRLGGGFIMKSEVTNVPKGSGLGTSSILSATSVKAIFEFMGAPYTYKDLYSRVLCMEQIMSTGGGWQDQVGGITNGIKYSLSKPGILQDISVSYIDISKKTAEELNKRFCLIYTGQRRLARNLLRDVVGNYIGNNPTTVFALNKVKEVSIQMKEVLQKGNVDEFAKLFNLHWELSNMIDAGSSNTLIEHIFRSIDDLVDGKMVCGAGGGGFLQVILKKGISKEEVHLRLKETFEDCPVDVWPCQLLFN
jgi:fucokinase